MRLSYRWVPFAGSGLALDYTLTADGACAAATDAQRGACMLDDYDVTMERHVCRYIKPGKWDAAAAEHRLEQHGLTVRQAALECLGLERRELLVDAVVAGEERHARSLHEALGRVFGAHVAHRLPRWADERQPCCAYRVRKGRVLREEAVPRVDGLSAGGERCVNHAVDSQVRVLGGRAAHAHCRICQPHVLAEPVRLGKDSDARDA